MCLTTLQANCTLQYFPSFLIIGGFSLKLIVYKIKNVKIYFWSLQSSQREKGKAPKAACDQSKEYEKSRTRKFSTKWQVGQP